MYPSTSLFIAIGQLAIVILVMFSYPLQVHPCRHYIDKVFHPEHMDSAKTDVDDEDSEFDDDGHSSHKELSPLKHFAFTAGIVVLGFTTAFMVNDLQLGMFEVRRSSVNLG